MGLLSNLRRDERLQKATDTLWCNCNYKVGSAISRFRTGPGRRIVALADLAAGREGFPNQACASCTTTAFYYATGKVT